MHIISAVREIACALMVLVFGLSSFAQGLIAFANDDSSLIIVKLPQSEEAPVTQGYLEMLWAVPGTAFAPWDPQSQTPGQWLAANPGWQELTTSVTRIGNVPGLFNTGTKTIPTPSPGAEISAVLAGWSGYYPTLELAYDAAIADRTHVFSREFFGTSRVFTVNTGDPATEPPATLPIGAADGQFNGVTMQPILFVPEPSSLTLTLLAGGVLAFGVCAKRTAGARE